MKNIAKSILVLSVAFVAAAFTTSVVKQLNITESNITWKGKKVLGTHTGTINLKRGYLETDGDNITGGMFVVDMTSIAVTDLKAGQGKEKLEGHLKSDDFFGIEKHKEASLVFTSLKEAKEGYTVTGDLTIKGETHPVTFDMTVDANNGMAQANVEIDRTKYGIRYGSGSFFDDLGDKAINNAFELSVDLKF